MNIRLFFNEEEHKGAFLIATFMLGIVAYFALPFEPNLLVIGSVLGVLLFFILLCLKKSFSYFVFLLFMFVFGVFVSNLHTILTDTRFLKEKMTDVFVTGEIVRIDTKLSTAQILLENINIEGVEETKTPKRIKIWVQLKSVTDKTANFEQIEVFDGEAVDKLITKRGKIKNLGRISTDSVLLKKPQPGILKKGDTIRGLAFNLTAPHTPVFRGGYFQARDLFFDNIGAVGAFSSVDILKRNKNQITVLDNIKDTVKEKISFFNQDVKGVVLSLVLGEQHLLTAQIQTLYRYLGLTHILSVSGFHISLIAFLTYVFMRFLLTGLFLKTSVSAFLIRQISGIISLCVTLFYVAISGAEPPAVRAFIMVCFLFACFFVNRKVISLRTIFIAAFLLLCYKPILVLNVGFQLSFIAVLAICVLVRDCSDKIKERFCFSRLVYFLVALFILNLIVTLITIPFIGYHFHKIALYGLIGNLLLSFVFSLLVMPFLVVGVFLMPFDFEKPILKTVEYILNQVHMLGEKIALLPFPEIPFPAFSSWGLLLFAFGFIFLCVFKHRTKYIGVILILISPLSYMTYDKSDVLIANEGRIIALRNDNNKLILNESFRHRFVSDNWLLANGELPYFYSSDKAFNYLMVDVQGVKIAFSPLKCQEADITFEIKKGDYKHCPNLYSKDWLIKSGTVDIIINKGQINIKRLSKTDAKRPWNRGD